MADFDYTTRSAVYGQIFLKFPVTLIRGSKYTAMSANAKVAYMVLLDRLQYSIKNNWVDTDDHVYFIFTLNELAKLLNCSRQTAVNTKHELERFGLLLQKQVGLNQPNRLYLAKLAVNREDSYLLDSELETRTGSGSLESRLPESPSNSGSLDSRLPLESTIRAPQTLENTGSLDSRPYLEPGSRDLTRDLKETTSDNFSKTQSSTPEKGAGQNQPLKPELLPEQDNTLERMLLDNFADSIDPAVSGDILSRSSLQLIGKWSHSVKEARERVGVILNAKRDAELEYDTYLVTEDLQDELNKALLRVVMRWKDQLDGRSERSIRNVDNYLYGAMKQIFENESVRQLNLQAKDDADRAALRDLQDRFADARTGKQARMEAREVNRARRRQREHKQANA